jgi:hypothetical protein
MERFGYLHGLTLRTFVPAIQASAITAMAIFIPLGWMGSLAPWRAGGFLINHLFHSSFMPAKSSDSAKMKVAFTALSSVVPAASRMA